MVAEMSAASLIREIPDFPKEGILFRDITPVLKDPRALAEVIDTFAEYANTVKPDVILGIESRGFIVGAPLAVKLGKGFIPVRKVGKLPYETIRCEYSLEYGTNAVEIHKDAIEPGQRVLVVDDLLATGGTAAAAVSLIEELGGQVAGVAFLIELEGLGGRDKLPGYDVKSFVVY